MKNLILLSLFSLIFLFGCNQESEITSPFVAESGDNVSWLTLPSPEDGLTINTLTLTRTKTIDGKTGGTLDLYASYFGGPFKKVFVQSELIFPPNSFSGSKDITVFCTPEEGLTRFGPSMNFNKELKFNLSYMGVDLTGINPNTVKFCYLAVDGTVREVVHDGIEFDFVRGRISVINAKISHFSRYGFVR